MDAKRPRHPGPGRPPIFKHNARMMGLESLERSHIGGGQPAPPRICEHNARMMGLEKAPVIFEGVSTDFAMLNKQRGRWGRGGGGAIGKHKARMMRLERIYTALRECLAMERNALKQACTALKRAAGGGGGGGGVCKLDARMRSLERIHMSLKTGEVRGGEGGGAHTMLT